MHYNKIYMISVRTLPALYVANDVKRKHTRRVISAELTDRRPGEVNPVKFTAFVFARDSFRERLKITIRHWYVKTGFYRYSFFPELIKLILCHVVVLLIV